MSSSGSLVPSLEYNGVGRTTLITSWVLTGIACICLILQIINTIVRKKRFGIDDLFNYFAFAIALALVSLTTWAVVNEGQGSHMNVEPRPQFVLVAKSLFINEVLWGVVNTFLRLVALFLLRGVFASVHGLFRTSTTTLILMSIAYGIAVIITPVLICKPIQAGWDPEVLGNCGSEKASYLALEILGLVLDLFITFTPIFPIIMLKIRILKKVHLSFLFAASGLVVVVTAFRLAALRRVNSRDFTYDYGYLGLLSVTGALVGIILASLPSLNGLIVYIKQSSGLRTKLHAIWQKLRPSKTPLPSSNDSTTTLVEYEDCPVGWSLKAAWLADEERVPTREGSEVIYMETYRKSLRPLLVMSPESQTHERVVSPAASSHESVTDATHPGISIESGKSVSKSIAEGDANVIEIFEGLPTAITPLRTEEEAEDKTEAKAGDKAGDEAAEGGSGSDIIIPEKAVTARESV